MSKPKYYITTAIAYTSGKPHIGNTYEAVLADAIARYKRQQGYDVFFQTGTDEHGQKIELKAEEAGITPKEFVDNVSGQIKNIWDLMNTSYDKFIRTTDADHEKQVQKIFKKMYAKGDIYKGEYEGMYCTPCESFFTESQLVDGKCPDCGRPCVPAKEEAYFFKMSKYADRLIEHIKTHPEFIQPESRKNEMMNNFLLPGLQDLCVSRTSFKWGIPVDFDPKHVVYVWLDALTNYITGIGYGCGSYSTCYEYDFLFLKFLNVLMAKLRWLSKWSNEILEVVSCFQLRHPGGGSSSWLEYDCYSAFLCVIITDCKRNSLAYFVHLNDNELTRQTVLSHARSFHIHKKNICRKFLCVEYLIHSSLLKYYICCCSLRGQ